MHISGVMDEGDEVLVTGGIHVGAAVQFFSCLLLPQVRHQPLVDPVWVTHSVDQRFKHCTEGMVEEHVCGTHNTVMILSVSRLHTAAVYSRLKMNGSWMQLMPEY